MLVLLVLMVMPIVIALALGARFHRLSLLLAMMAVPVPCFLPDSWIVGRALASLGAAWCLAVSIDFVCRPEAMGLTRRVWCLISAFDARNSQRTAPRVDFRLACSAVAFAMLGTVGFVVAFVAPHNLVLRWGGGLVGFYCGVEAGTRTVETLYRVGGVEIPRTQLHPVLALSIAEFWGRRWNRPVSRWLRRYCLTPLARTGWPRTGLVVAFIASGALHFYFVWVAMGVSLALAMLAFFVLQVPLAFLERALEVRAWPEWCARTWTVLGLALPSPLFIEPVLRLMGLIEPF